MKYMADDFINELKQANGKQIRRRRSKCNKKKKKAYSDGDVRDVAEELFDLASDERIPYEKKDAKMAVDIAKREYLRYQMDDLRGMVKEAAQLAIKDLKEYWKKEGHI